MRYNIYVEKVWNDKTWANLLNFIDKHECTLFLMPPQAEYQRSVLSYKGSAKQLTEKLKSRYSLLSSYNLGMHVHLSIHPEELGMDVIRKVKSQLKFLEKATGIIITDVSFGWYCYDDRVKRFCRKNDLNIVNDDLTAISVHDYQLPLSFSTKFSEYLRQLIRIFRKME
jgi:hypothetical protein